MYYRNTSIPSTPYQFNVRWIDSTVKFIDTITLSSDTGKSFFSSGSDVEISLSNLGHDLAISSVGETNLINNGDYVYDIYFLDSSNAYTSVSPKEVRFNASDDSFYDLALSFENVPCDTYAIIINIVFSPLYSYGYTASFGQNLTGTINLCFGAGRISIKETPEDKTDSLLDNIIQWLTSIRDNIVNLPSLIANAIKGFFDNIVNAITDMVSALQEKLQSVLDGIVNKLTDLGNFLIDGIKGLFVPDSDTLAAEKDKWDELLESRFGALYEVIALIDDYAQTFQASEKGTITMPEVSIPLGDANFIFGGWEVKIIPDGFSVLIDALKLIISISATILFGNGLRNRFERVVDG